jgi:hypothetical protein
MKKALIACALAGLILSCGGGYNSSSEKGFAIQPGDLTAITMNANKVYSTSLPGGNHAAGVNCHAIIFSGTVNSIAIVGFAISADPSQADPTINSTFCLKVYFPSSSVPATFNFDAGQPNNIALFRADPVTSFTTGTGTMTFNFADNGDTTYTITATGGPIAFGGDNLTNTLNIVAQKY